MTSPRSASESSAAGSTLKMWTKPAARTFRNTEQAEAAQRSEAERSGRLAHGIAAVRAALSANHLDEAERACSGRWQASFRKSGKCKAWPTSSAGESGNGWWCQPRMPCATSYAVPTAMIPRLLSLVWPACRWTVYPTTSRGVFSGCGRTRALNWSSSVAGTSRTATRRRPVGVWSSLGRHPRGRTKSSAHLARPSGSRASSSWVHSRVGHENWLHGSQASVRRAMVGSLPGGLRARRAGDRHSRDRRRLVFALE